MTFIFKGWMHYLRVLRVLRDLLFKSLLFLLICDVLLVGRDAADAADIFLRCRVHEPAAERFQISLGGHRHHSNPWNLPEKKVEVSGNGWSDWVDLRDWPLHGRADREGGLAEWPSILLTAISLQPKQPVKNCTFEVQLSDQPEEQHVVISFKESTESATIGFLAVHPLREHKDEFETGSQMTRRHQEWARQIVGENRAKLKKMVMSTGIWGIYDPALVRMDVETLDLLGFNVINYPPPSILRRYNMRDIGHIWLFQGDPDAITTRWVHVDRNKILERRKTEDGKWFYDNMAFMSVNDEITAVGFTRVDKAKLTVWFADYLRSKGVSAEDVGQPLDQIEFPAKTLYEKSLPRDAPLPTRRMLYWASKFGHWWSAKQLRHISNLIKAMLPKTKTSTLPSSHSFMHGGKPYRIGMGYRMLDLFEVAEHHALDILQSEDWFGLNHMYGPGYTWTGGQTFGFINAVTRSSIGDNPITLMGHITPSDDGYLRLKTYSALAQGARGFFFRLYGPTFTSTENYWSDLRSEYEGLAKISRHLEKAEDVLMQAKPVSDPVAILFAASHDIWHTDRAAAGFVEKRLLWHALRHLSVQPDFLREEDVQSGRLKNYRVLYVTDNCITRKASHAIDEWVKAGGVLYLCAGAATRDEYFEPHLPPFAQRVWPSDAAAQLVAERHFYNERGDLPTIKPLSHVTCQGAQGSFELPAIGCRLNLRDGLTGTFAHFRDDATAGAVLKYGRGHVMAVGFMPMLAYGQLANFQPTTLEEKWPAEPRGLVDRPLKIARVVPAAQADVPVVATGLLAGTDRSALILANYTYEPVPTLTVNVRIPHRVARVVSCEVGEVDWEMIEEPGNALVRVKLPLEWTDIVLFLPD